MVGTTYERVAKKWQSKEAVHLMTMVLKFMQTIEGKIVTLNAPLEI